MTTPPIRRTALAAAAAALALMTTTAAAPPQGAYTDQSDTAFQSDCLTTINAYRAKHQAPPLTTDPKTVDYAKTRAQKVSQPNGFHHNGLADGYGEILGWTSYATRDTDAAYTPRTCQAAVDAWYREIRNYDFADPGFKETAGNFTQLVWKSTTTVGCARVGGPRDQTPDHDGFRWFDTYIACEFTPPGNLTTDPHDPAKDYKDNVLPAP
ncbi:CAP family protein [Kitasatospora brasiliensis]|uniref:CAP family protein n=1 Tax=Kitasatospora brasiliensis TaxID=3058040 RepID=UPI002930F1BC|nr:CAP family protein [Kitasatospora sp. K002]